MKRKLNKREDVLYRYHKTGQSILDISRVYGCSYTAIERIIEEEGYRNGLFPELLSVSAEDARRLLLLGVHSREEARSMLDRIESGAPIKGVGEKKIRMLKAFAGESVHPVYLANAFSLQMLDLERKATVSITPVDAAEVASVPELISVVGHADTAAVLSDMLGKEIAFNRVSLKLEPGDILYVAQVVGGRLPEGSTTLPEGFEIKFVRVDLK